MEFLWNEGRCNAISFEQPCHTKGHTLSTKSTHCKRPERYCLSSFCGAQVAAYWLNIPVTSMLLSARSASGWHQCGLCVSPPVLGSSTWHCSCPRSGRWTKASRSLYVPMSKHFLLIWHIWWGNIRIRYVENYWDMDHKNSHTISAKCQSDAVSDCLQGARSPQVSERRANWDMRKTLTAWYRHIPSTWMTGSEHEVIQKLHLLFQSHEEKPTHSNNTFKNKPNQTYQERQWIIYKWYMNLYEW